MEEDTEEREHNKRQVCGLSRVKRKTVSVIHMTDSVTAGKMMKKKRKKRGQTDRGSAGSCQMMTATTSNQPITAR